MAKKNTTQGLGMANVIANHQYFVTRIFGNYIKKFGFNIAPAITVKKHPERVPDIVIFDEFTYDGEDTNKPILTIEITRTAQNDKYSRESIIETMQFVPSLNESFIYNFAKDTWTRFTYTTDGNIIEEKDKDYSRTLGIYMHTLL